MFCENLLLRCRYFLRFPFAMNGSTILGTPSGESRHIPINPTMFGCLKDFIRALSSKKLLMSDAECKPTRYRSMKITNTKHTNTHNQTNTMMCNNAPFISVRFSLYVLNHSTCTHCIGLMSQYAQGKDHSCHSGSSMGCIRTSVSQVQAVISIITTCAWC